jgi:spermidine synthase
MMDGVIGDEDAGGRPPGVRPRPGSYPLTRGSAQVLRDLDVPDGWLLLIDDVASSYVNLDDPRHLDFEYMAWIGAALDCLAPPGTALDAVHLGGAACTLPRYLAATRPESRQVVFEPDPLLLRLAAEMFGVRPSPRLRLEARDGRAGLADEPDAAADVLVRDAFTGPAAPGPVVPEQLRGAEFLREVARVLRPAGTYLANLSDRPPLAGARAEAAAARAVFPHVALVTEPSILRGRRHGNVVLLASRRPLPVAALVRAAGGGAVPARVVHGERLDEFLGAGRPLRESSAED